MPERISKQISWLRSCLNGEFQNLFNRKLIRANEEGIVNLDDPCNSKNDFVLLIGTLATLIDDLNREALSHCLQGKFEKEDAISLVDRFLEKSNLAKGEITANMRLIKRVRATVFPIHKGLSKEFSKLMKKINCTSPYDWKDIWNKCLNLYIRSLKGLIKQFNEMNFRIKYKSELEKDRAKELGRKVEVTYLNDVLYKYRVFVPSKYKYSDALLVDYLTAAVIAFDRGLKSINYALKKYVTPVKDKFKEHTEDAYFVARRRHVSLGEMFYGKEAAKEFPILLSRDDVGFKSDEEFRRYVNHYIKPAVIAYQHGITPDWVNRCYSV